MQWHSFTSLELSVPDIPSAEEETRDFMQIIKIFLPKKKSPTPNQAEMFSQPTERISDRQRLRIQSDETGKPVWKEEEYRDINVWTWLQDIPVWCKGALSKHWPTLLQIKQDCLISMLTSWNFGITVPGKAHYRLCCSQDMSWQLFTERSSFQTEGAPTLQPVVGVWICTET